MPLIVECFGKNIYINGKIVGYIGRNALYVNGKKFADLTDDGSFRYGDREIGFVDEDGTIFVDDEEAGYVDPNGNFVFYDPLID